MNTRIHQLERLIVIFKDHKSKEIKHFWWQHFIQKAHITAGSETNGQNPFETYLNEAGAIIKFDLITEAKSPYCTIIPKSPCHAERGLTQHSDVRSDVKSLRWITLQMKRGRGHVATANHSNYQALITGKWHRYTWVCLFCADPGENIHVEMLKWKLWMEIMANRLDFSNGILHFHSQRSSAIRGCCKSQSAVIILVLIRSSPAGTCDCWLNTAHLHSCTENPFHHISGN